MKLFLIFCVSYLAGVHGVALKNKDVQEEGMDVKVIRKCALEMNIDAEKYIKSDLSSVIQGFLDEETTCVAACSFRRLITDSHLAQELSGPTNKDTLYNGCIKMIDEAFRTGFGKQSTGYSREDVVKKVDKCRTQESTECGFFKCVGLYEEPIKLVASYYIVHNLFLQ